MDGPNLASIELQCIVVEDNRSREECRRRWRLILIRGRRRGASGGGEGVADAVKEVLDHLGLEAFPKTSGGKGMHLYVPLNTAVTFEETKAFAPKLAEGLERGHPELVNVEHVEGEARKERCLWIGRRMIRIRRRCVCIPSGARERPTVSARR